MDWAIQISNPDRLLMCQADTEDDARQMTQATFPGCTVHHCGLSAVKSKRAEVHVPSVDEYGESQELHDPPQQLIM